jgi:hypothetical protein
MARLSINTALNSVVLVGEFCGWAFAYCTSLTDVYFGGTEAQWNDLTISRDN